MEEAATHLQKAIELSSAALKRIAADYFEKNTGMCAALSFTFALVDGRIHTGKFWQLVETRPYVRATQAYGHWLALQGRAVEALPVLMTALRLSDADDPIGLAHTLMHAAVRAGNWNLCMQAVARNKARMQARSQGQAQPPLAWEAFLEALYLFKVMGAQLLAIQALSRAYVVSSHFVLRVLGRVAPSAVPPLVYGVRKETEGDVLFHAIGDVWQREHAADWLRDMLTAGLGLHPCAHCSETIFKGLEGELRVQALMAAAQPAAAAKSAAELLEQMPPPHPMTLRLCTRAAFALLQLDRRRDATAMARRGLDADIMAFTKKNMHSAPQHQRAQLLADAALTLELNEPYTAACRQLQAGQLPAALPQYEAAQPAERLPMPEHKHHAGCKHQHGDAHGQQHQPAQHVHGPNCKHEHGAQERAPAHGQHVHGPNCKHGAGHEHGHDELDEHDHHAPEMTLGNEHGHGHGQHAPAHGQHVHGPNCKHEHQHGGAPHNMSVEQIRALMAQAALRQQGAPAAEPHCSRCGKGGDALQACGSCLSVRYCSRGMCSLVCACMTVADSVRAL